MTAPRPGLPASRYAEVAQASACVVIEGYSTSFGVATRLLREPVRTHVRCIYALVRVADEVVDDAAVPWTQVQRAELLDGLERDTLSAIASGASTNLVVHAFATTARRYGIGSDLVRPFFDSMRADLSVRVHDPASLASYVHGSAEVVGLMCLRVFVDGDEGRYEELAPGARRLGAAFQKVNFLRDLAADREGLGRSYFPGVDPDRLTDAQRDRLLDDIEADLQAAAAAIRRLPPDCRRAVHAAHALFGALVHRLRATPACDIARTRVRVPDLVKAGIVVRSLVATR
jgi:15-cis-phytoene synthase